MMNTSENYKKGEYSIIYEWKWEKRQEWSK